MSDLIDRQAILDALKERCESECEYSKKQRSVMCSACYLGSAIEVIESLPSAERPKGKWLRTWHEIFKEDLLVCSYCGSFAVYGTKYCSNCGAEMERD